MLINLTLALTMLVQAPPPQNAQDVMRMVRAKQLARLATVDNYTIMEEMTGGMMAVPLYFEKMSVGGQSTFRMVPPLEWMGADTTMALEMMKGMSMATRMLSGAIRSGKMDGGMPGPMGAMMNNMMAGMLDSIGMMYDIVQAEPRMTDGRVEAAQDLQSAAIFARRARLIGRDMVGGREAYLLRADHLSDIPIEQMEDGPEFTLDVASIWIAVDEFVQLRFKVDGHMTADGRTVPVTIEKLQLDFAHFGPLYESQRHLLRISGLMEAMTADPRQRREFERVRRDALKAQEDLAKMEAQLEQMPAAQRRMMEGHLARARQQLAMIVNDGVVEVETRRTVRDWNKGPPRDWRPFGVPPGPP